MFCTPCKYDPSKIGKFIDGTDNYRVDALKQHDSSSSHITAQRKIRHSKFNGTVENCVLQVYIRAKLMHQHPRGDAGGGGVKMRIRPPYPKHVVKGD